LRTQTNQLHDHFGYIEPGPGKENATDPEIKKLTGKLFLNWTVKILSLFYRFESSA